MDVIKQISVFLENKPGRLATFIDLMDRIGVRIQAMGIAEAGNYGIVRTVVDDSEKAMEALKKENMAVNMADVVLIDLKDMRAAIRLLGESGVNVDYAYTMDGGKVVVKVDKADTAMRVLAGLRPS